jgi:hypothetical protein
MTREENLELRDRLKDMGLIVDTFSGCDSQWAASWKNPNPNMKWNNITIVDCSYGGEDYMKYRIKMDDGVFNKAEFFVGKRISECTVEEVMDSVKKIELMYKEWQIEKKIARMEDDFR